MAPNGDHMADESTAKQGSPATVMSRRKFRNFLCCRGSGYQVVRSPRWTAVHPTGPGAPEEDEGLYRDQESREATDSLKGGRGGSNHLIAQVPKDTRLYQLYPPLGVEDYNELMRLHDEFPSPLLGPQAPQDAGRKTLVLDLDETLVHSSFQPVSIAAFVLPVEIEQLVYEIYVAKRPGVDEFLKFCADLYEVVIFTASLGKYAGPLLDKLDPERRCPWRLYRESCVLWQGNYVKDLSKLGRDLKDVLIVDNSPASYMLQPDNAIPIRSWFDDMGDRELYELMPILKALSKVDDIQGVLRRTAIGDSDDDTELPY